MALKKLYFGHKSLCHRAELSQKLEKKVQIRFCPYYIL